MNLTVKQAKELGLTPELAEQLPEGVLYRLDFVDAVKEQQAVVDTSRVKMEEAHGVYNTKRQALKKAADMLAEMIREAQKPSLFAPAGDGAEKKPEPPKKEPKKKAKPKRGGLQHPAVKAATGQREEPHKAVI